MGTKLSIDKIVSELEDILAIDPTFFRRIRFLNRNPSGIAHHLKVELVSRSCGDSTNTNTNEEKYAPKPSVSTASRLPASLSRIMKPTWCY